MSKRIGILTGGGDVPGLNAVIKSVVYRATENQCEVIGIRKGWEGLTHCNLDDPASNARYIWPLDRANTRTIDRSGGTVLHTSRISPSRIRRLPEFMSADGVPRNGEWFDLTQHAVNNLDRLGIEYLIAIGGDGTLATTPSVEKLGVKVIGIPKTMDNDVRNTEYCIGFSTAITRATDSIQRQRTTVGSHERYGLFRIFGRESGFTALYAAYTTSIRCCIPEYDVSLDRLLALLAEEKRNTPSNYALVVLSEGAKWQGYVPAFERYDASGHVRPPSIAEALKTEIAERLGEESMASDLTYELRSGEPDFVDKLVATTFGNIATDAILAGKHGLMTALVGGTYTLVSLPDPTLGPRKVDLDSLYNVPRYRPKYADRLGLPIFLTSAED